MATRRSSTATSVMQSGAPAAPHQTGGARTYVDTSVVLRNVFDEGEPLEFWRYDTPAASELLHVEARRAIHRRRLAGEIDDAQVAQATEALYALLEHLGVIFLDSTVLARAAGPFPSHVRTLDAIHLASALLWNEQDGSVREFLTHDHRQAVAARALAFRVTGVPDLLAPGVAPG